MELSPEERALIEGMREHGIQPSFIVMDAKRWMIHVIEDNEYARLRDSQYHTILESIRRTYTA